MYHFFGPPCIHTTKTLNGFSRFLAWRLSVTHPTLRRNEIRVITKMRILPSRALSKMADSEIVATAGQSSNNKDRQGLALFVAPAMVYALRLECLPPSVAIHSACQLTRPCVARPSATADTNLYVLTNFSSFSTSTLQTPTRLTRVNHFCYKGPFHVTV